MDRWFVNDSPEKLSADFHEAVKHAMDVLQGRRRRMPGLATESQASVEEMVALGSREDPPRVTIGVCKECFGAGSVAACPVWNGERYTFVSDRKCPTCKGSGYGKQ